MLADILYEYLSTLPMESWCFSDLSGHCVFSLSKSSRDLIGLSSISQSMAFYTCITQEVSSSGRVGSSGCPRATNPA